MTSTDMTVGIILLGAAAAVLAAVTIYNRLVRSSNRVREAWSGIDIQLKRRASLVPNLVETVRGYAAHERAVFDEVSRARGALQQARAPAAAASANQALTEALGRLFAVAESYPILRAVENFLSLQRELSDVEDKIAFARQFYNRTVLDYNTRVQAFPGALLSGSLGFEPADFFEADATARAEVKVSLQPPSVSGSAAPEPPLVPPTP